ncbi:TolC family protein [Desertivirga arenae]|uniref:TolC family protein n=1 Tax=Desertivirga arenae TaxID=2810309 RepID=UPI001A95874D|nr:TolC family protein [Pedobacter sp. SYSU D00823]
MTTQLHKLKSPNLLRASLKLGAACLTAVALSFAPSIGFAQKKVLSVDEAVELGIQNSNALKLSQARINEAVERFNQAKEGRLPKASASLMFNHAEILTNEFRLPGSAEPIRLPSRANAYIGSASIEQLIFAGNKLKYATESTSLLTQISKLDADKQKEDIVYGIVNSCYNLYRIQQSQKVIQQNLQAVDKQLQQAQQFFSQGIVTKNDVLRFQLQRNNIELTAIDLESNRNIVNFNLDILLGLPQTTELEITSFRNVTEGNQSFSTMVDTAVTRRVELRETEIQSKLADNAIKDLKADYLPTLGVGANLYYIDPSSNPFPSNKSVLAPASVAASLSWSIDKFWTNKSRIAEAKIKKDEVDISRRLTEDNIRTEVNRDYQNYIKSLNRIKILESSIAQAQENDRILESKYRNNIASVTDRIDAETQLYQSLINLELAKADAGLAYYTLLKSTGTLTSK